MKSNLKKTLSLSILLAGCTATVWYLNLDQPLPEDSSTVFSRAADKDDKQLLPQIDTINPAITEPQKDRPAQPQRDLDAKVSRLNRNIAALRDRLNTLSDNIAANSPSSVTDDESQEAALSEEEREAVAKAQIEQQLGIYDNVAAQEGVDPDWAPQAEVDVYESLHHLSDDGVGVSEVKCHSSLCTARFSLDHENTEVAISKLQVVAPWEGEALIWIEDMEQGEGLIYLAREGETLPDNQGEM